MPTLRIVNVGNNITLRHARLRLLLFSPLTFCHIRTQCYLSCAFDCAVFRYLRKMEREKQALNAEGHTSHYLRRAQAIISNHVL